MKWLNRIRPQILVAILILGAIAGYSLNVGETGVANGAMGGLIALSMSILEKDNGE